MELYQDRVIQEKGDLDYKIVKLTEFSDDDNKLFSTLPEEEQSRLKRQLVVMRDYSDILAERIAAFPPSNLTIIQ